MLSKFFCLKKSKFFCGPQFRQGEPSPKFLPRPSNSKTLGFPKLPVSPAAPPSPSLPETPQRANSPLRNSPALTLAKSRPRPPPNLAFAHQGRPVELPWLIHLAAAAPPRVTARPSPARARLTHISPSPAPRLLPAWASRQSAPAPLRRVIRRLQQLQLPQPRLSAAIRRSTLNAFFTVPPVPGFQCFARR